MVYNIQKIQCTKGVMDTYGLTWSATTIIHVVPFITVCPSTRLSHLSCDSFPMCPLQINQRVPHLRQTGQGRRASAAAISHAWTLLCGSVDVIKMRRKNKRAALQTTVSCHTNTEHCTNSQLSMKWHNTLFLQYCLPFSSFPFTWCSHVSCHCLFQFPSSLSLSLSLLSLIAILAHKLTHYSNSYPGRGKGLLINEGRCPVSVEELWIAVVCLIRLHELLEQLEAATRVDEKQKYILIVKGFTLLLSNLFIYSHSFDNRLFIIQFKLWGFIFFFCIYIIVYWVF